MSEKKKLRKDPRELEFRNCVHKIHMELDLAERGLNENFRHADIMNVVVSMSRSLEDLRGRLDRIRESYSGENQ